MASLHPLTPGTLRPLTSPSLLPPLLASHMEAEMGWQGKLIGHTMGSIFLPPFPLSVGDEFGRFETKIWP